MAQSVEAPARTQKQRWGAAVKAIRTEGLVTRQNVKSSSYGMAYHELYQKFGSDARFAFTYGSEGNATHWDDDKLMKRGESNWGLIPGPTKAHSIVWKSSDARAAQTIKAAFEAQGFTVKWGGPEGDDPEVIVNEDVK